MLGYFVWMLEANFDRQNNRNDLDKTPSNSHWPRIRCSKVNLTKYSQAAEIFGRRLWINEHWSDQIFVGFRRILLSKSSLLWLFEVLSCKLVDIIDIINEFANKPFIQDLSYWININWIEWLMLYWPHVLMHVSDTEELFHHSVR